MPDKPKTIEVLVSPQGVARHIHSDEATAITAAIGTQEIRRASHVEPAIELSDAAILWLFQQGPYHNYAYDHALTVLPATSHAAFLRSRLAINNISNKWFAALLPVAGPVLGPFDTHAEAITAELAWLNEHHIPTCPDGKC